MLKMTVMIVGAYLTFQYFPYDQRNLQQKFEYCSIELHGIMENQ